MVLVEKQLILRDTMLHKYSINGSYADCYSTEIPGSISFADFVFAFYTTPLFRLERWILKFTVSKPSTDVEARQLADGKIDKFAAWNVENRGDNELLMCDFSGRTRSWMMATSNEARTRLYFGSAVVPVRDVKTGKLSMGLIFQALLGFHKIYSVLLLYFAKLRIQSDRGENL